MTSPALFDRKIIVRVDTLEIECDASTGLHVDFDAEKRADSHPNSAQFAIYNLNPDHRGELTVKAASKQKVLVEILAGYAHPGPSRIFRGDLSNVIHERNGPDWVTTVEAGDGYYSVSRAKIFKSWGPGTPVSTVLRDLVEALGLGRGNLETVAKTAKFLGGGDAFVGGTTCSGPAMKELSRITKSIGVDWMISDGTLQFLSTGKSLEGTAIVLSPDSGLIGSPKPFVKKGKNGAQQHGVHVQTLMIGDVYPGRKLKIESDAISGFFVAGLCRYAGSNYQDPFYIDIDAVSL